MTAPTPKAIHRQCRGLERFLCRQRIQAQRDELHEMIYGPDDVSHMDFTPFPEFVKDHPELAPLLQKDTTMTDLKIEAGKCYRTESGEKMRALAVRTDLPGSNYPVVGFIEGRSGTLNWSLDGSYGPGFLSHLKLISEWKEPRKGEVWVAAFDDGLSERDGAVKFVTFRTEAEAKAALFCGEKAFAIKGVTLTEGQGLTGEGSE